jgi:hypothetical protein
MHLAATEACFTISGMNPIEFNLILSDIFAAKAGETINTNEISDSSFKKPLEFVINPSSQMRLKSALI